MLGVVLLQGVVSAQSQSTYATDQKALYLQYLESMGSASRVFNGKEYYHTDFQVGNHPFLDRKAFNTSQIQYDGYWFDGIDLMFDIFREVLVIGIKDESGNLLMLEADKNRIDAFTVAGRLFISLDLNGGRYYEELFSGKYKLVVHRQKKQRPGSGNYQYEFYPDDSFFLQVDNKYLPLKSKADFYKLFGDQKKEMKRIARQAEYNLLPLEAFLVVMLNEIAL